MTKWTPPDLTAGYRSAEKLDQALAEIATQLDNTVSRDGTTPNQMEAALDLNGNRILNVAAPTQPTDVIRLMDLNPGDVVGTAVLWTDVVGKPTTFPPEPTTASNITDFQEAVEDRVGSSVIAGTNVNVSYDDSTGKTTVSATAPPSGSVAYADITGKPSTFPPSAHTHNESEITGLVADLANKSPVGHTHSQSDVTGLVAALAAKADSTALTSGLAGKSDVGHTHSASDITNFTEAAQDAVAGALIGAGTVSVAYNDAANTITITGSGGGSGVPYGYQGAWENTVTTGGTATTNTTNLNNLITTLSTAGGGAIWFNVAGAYQINGTITLKSNVDLIMCPGAVLYWVGSTSGTIIQTSSSESMKGLLRTVINVHSGSGHTGKMFLLKSMIHNTMELNGYGTSTSNTFVEINPDWAGPATIIGETNHAFNRYKLYHHETCGKGLYVHGDSSHITTLNTFTNTTFYQGIGYRGILLDSWCDNNEFDGFTYMLLTGSNSIGVGINESAPTDGGASGVYGIHFTHLAVDTFAGPTGRIAFVVNGSRAIYCDAFFNQPVAEGGDFIGTNGVSYQVRKFNTTTDGIKYHQKGIDAATT